MKIKMNDMSWEIKEISQKELKTIQNIRKNKNDDDIDSIDSRYYGVTYLDNLVIYLDKDLPKERKRHTLMHELTHCYIAQYITHQEKTYDEEMVADIVANSHDIIHDIVEKYFK